MKKNFTLLTIATAFAFAALVTSCNGSSSSAPAEAAPVADTVAAAKIDSVKVETPVASTEADAAKHHDAKGAKHHDAKGAKH